MNATSLALRIQRGLRVVCLSCLILLILSFILGGFFGWHREVRGLDDLRAQFLLTLVSMALGAGFGSFQAGSYTDFPRRSTILLLAILLSQIFFLLLLWTSWKASSLSWRLWWLTMIATVTTTHILLLRRYATSPGRRIERATAVCCGLCGVLLSLLALRNDPVAEPETLFRWALGVSTAGALAGSAVVWVRWQQQKTMSPWVWQSVRIGGLLTLQCAILFVAFYLGRVTAPPSSGLELLPSTLAHLTQEEREAQVRADLERLKTAATGLEEFAPKLAALQMNLRSRLAEEKRESYLPEEEDRIRALLMTSLAYRATLLRIMAQYQGYEAVPDPPGRARCFLLCYAASSIHLQSCLHLVHTCRDDALLQKKLNEADRAAGIPGGLLERIQENLATERHREVCEEMAAYCEHRRTGWRSTGVFASQDLEWLETRIDRAASEIRSNSLPAHEAFLQRLKARVRNDTYTPVYATQSLIATWIGDTRIVQRPPCITLEQIRTLPQLLQPGDILLERRNWFFSNAFLPGFWPHTALYVGTIEDLEKMNLVRREGTTWVSDHPAIRAHLAEYLQRAHDGEVNTVVEAVSEGVIFNSLTESMHADYVAVLRPRLSNEDKAQAIARAFSHHGKPYDFEFDFGSADKLVCSELVYRAYEGLLRFKLVRIMGRDTLPALEIARTFAQERGEANPQMEFVLFLDGIPDEGRARRAGAEEFCASINRPRGFHE